MEGKGAVWRELGVTDNLILDALSFFIIITFHFFISFIFLLPTVAMRHDERFQHQPSFISSSTCLLWGLFCLPFFKTLLCWELAVVARWWWGFPFMWEGVNTFLDRAVGAQSVWRKAAGSDDGQHNTRRRRIHSPTTCWTPPLFLSSTFTHLFSSCRLFPSVLPSFSHSTPSLLFSRSVLSHAYMLPIQHLEQNNTEHLYYSIGWLLSIFSPYTFSFFRAQLSGWSMWGYRSRDFLSIPILLSQRKPLYLFVFLFV